ncbi:MAG: 23S rRNA (adenine(2503)-C(2))-methyltransferase RlmN [Oscillospiraceae bacterium]|nr:23S rRNA (adenine(2503)-C(2))-methyltransferase RlmN [Oscillospiraceae bacterium]
MHKTDLKSLSFNEVVEEVKKLNRKPFHAAQIFSWISKGVLSFYDMTNLSLEFRKELDEKYTIGFVSFFKKVISKDNFTVKYLFSLQDDKKIESVLMKYHHGYTVCVSTQVGCKMGCVFCATGKSGFGRDLTPSEMLSQIQTIATDNKIRISNVVLMGMGEPLDNYYNTLKFLKIITCEKGLNIGNRHITVSTCGITDKIYDLAKKKLSLTLSVSLHAPNNHLRDKLLKVNKCFPLEDLLKACRVYSKTCKRRITFVYVMIKDINDDDDCARELAKKLSSIFCHVNLIPLNSIKKEVYVKSSIERIESFSRVLMKKGIGVTIRRTLGDDINASCGQLKA